MDKATDIATDIATDKRKWIKDDDRLTRKNTFEVIMKYIPKTMKVWMPFYCDGRCADYLREMGYEVYHEKRDFFTYQPDHWDIVIDNPPYSIKKKIVERLMSLGKPFILLLPLQTLASIFLATAVDETKACVLILSPRWHQFDRPNMDTSHYQQNPLQPCWYIFKYPMSKQIMYEP